MLIEENSSILSLCALSGSSPSVFSSFFLPSSALPFLFFYFLPSSPLLLPFTILFFSPRWDTTNAQISIFSAESAALLKVLPFTALSRSEYCHACFTYCQEFCFSNVGLPGLFEFISFFFFLFFFLFNLFFPHLFFSKAVP